MLVYATGNLINLATLASVSTEDVLYVKENLYCERPSKPFRFTAKAGQWVKVNVGAGVPITLMACFNHNLTNAAVIQADANNADAWPGPYHLHFTWRQYDFCRFLNQTYPWWRFLLSDAGNPFNPQLGELFFGTWTKFTNAKVQPGRDDSPIFHGVEQQTAYGQDWDCYFSDSQSFKLSLLNINDPATVDELHTFLRAIYGMAGRFVLIPDHRQPHVYYCKVTGSPSSSRPIYGDKELRRWGLEFKVLTRGITLL